eukprot:5647093-Prymnesium_polylepis.1
MARLRGGPPPRARATPRRPRLPSQLVSEPAGTQRGVAQASVQVTRDSTSCASSEPTPRAAAVIVAQRWRERCPLRAAKLPPPPPPGGREAATSHAARSRRRAAARGCPRRALARTHLPTLARPAAAARSPTRRPRDSRRSAGAPGGWYRGTGRTARRAT